MKAELFLIKGSIALLKAIMQELIEAGYKNLGTDIKGKFICQGHATSTYDCTDKRDRFIDIGIYDQSLPRFDFKSTTFELPQQYNEALAFAKKQLEDKYWVVTPKEWAIGTYGVVIVPDDVYKIGFIDKIYKIEGGIVWFEEFLCYKPNNTEYSIAQFKWFATRKEAEEFAETLKSKPVAVKESKQPKFKVGDYVVSKDYNKHIGRITSIDYVSTKYYYWGFSNSGDFEEKDWYGYESYANNCRLATPQKIEEFLIKVAKLKYKEGTYFVSSLVTQDHNRVRKVTPHDNEGKITFYVNKTETDYEVRSKDGIKCTNGECSNPLFYQNGVWCAVSEAKPVVKEEFVLPDKWCIKWTNEEIFNACNKHFGLKWSYYENSWSRSDESNYWSFQQESPLLNGYTEITLEQFEKHILSKTTPTITKLPFDNLEFTINKEKQFAKCDIGIITKTEVQSVITYWDTDIKLLGYSMEICLNKRPIPKPEWNLKFGCCEGTIEQARAILKAFN